MLLENVLITGVSQVNEDTMIAGEAAPPMLEEVTFAVKTITWTYEQTGTTHQDEVR